jgi:hypothetical protein
MPILTKNLNPDLTGAGPKFGKQNKVSTSVNVKGTEAESFKKLFDKNDYALTDNEGGLFILDTSTRMLVRAHHIELIKKESILGIISSVVFIILVYTVFRSIWTLSISGFIFVILLAYRKHTLISKNLVIQEGRILNLKVKEFFRVTEISQIKVSKEIVGGGDNGGTGEVNQVWLISGKSKYRLAQFNNATIGTFLETISTLNFKVSNLN